MTVTGKPEAALNVAVTVAVPAFSAMVALLMLNVTAGAASSSVMEPTPIASVIVPADGLLIVNVNVSLFSSFLLFMIYVTYITHSSMKYEKKFNHHHWMRKHAKMF